MVRVLWTGGVDECLIRRGELFLSLDFLEGYDRGLRHVNRGKIGRPYTLTEKYVEFLTIVRYLFGFPYRQLEGFTRVLNQARPKAISRLFRSWEEDTTAQKFTGC